MTVPHHAHLTYPRIAASGDRAIVIELSDRISEETNMRVVALADDLETRRCILEGTVPVDQVADLAVSFCLDGLAR